MNVLYDYQVFNAQEHGGVSRYYHELLKHLHYDSDVSVSCPLFFSNNYYLKHSPVIRPLSLQNKWIPFRKKLSNYLIHKNFLRSKKALLKQQFDIFHPTYEHPYFLEYIDKKPFVFTIHDMTPELNNPKTYKQTNKYILANKATKLIAVSQDTKNDFVRFYNVNPNNITVVHHGSSLHPAIAKAPKVKLPNKYILFVGKRIEGRNFFRFLQAIQKILHNNRELYLVLVGEPITKKEEELFESLHISQQIIQLFAYQEELAYLYKNALLFVIPSIFEGFGIPIIEAFSCGCPVAASNKRCLPEVGEDAAIYFDPYEVEDMQDKIKKVIYDKILQKTLRQKGFMRSKDFSWEKTAQETKAVYKSVL